MHLLMEGWYVIGSDVGILYSVQLDVIPNMITQLGPTTLRIVDRKQDIDGVSLTEM